MTAVLASKTSKISCSERTQKTCHEIMSLRNAITYENASCDHGGKVASYRRKIPNTKLRFVHRSAENMLSTK